jgi:hypothetical protein
VTLNEKKIHKKRFNVLLKSSSNLCTFKGKQKILFVVIKMDAIPKKEICVLHLDSNLVIREGPPCMYSRARGGVGP